MLQRLQNWLERPLVPLSGATEADKVIRISIAVEDKDDEDYSDKFDDEDEFDEEDEDEELE
jgi:hypothetical protein